MRILTVCEQGLNRSVTAKWLLQDCHEVIAAGTANLSRATLEMLCEWAERIILLDRSLQVSLSRFCPDSAQKLIVWDVGPDRYEHHYNRELLDRLRTYHANEVLS